MGHQRLLQACLHSLSYVASNSVPLPHGESPVQQTALCADSQAVACDLCKTTCPPQTLLSSSQSETISAALEALHYGNRLRRSDSSSGCSFSKWKLPPYTPVSHLPFLSGV